jgi:hypothetical protein
MPGKARFALKAAAKQPVEKRDWPEANWIASSGAVSGRKSSKRVQGGGHPSSLFCSSPFLLLRLGGSKARSQFSKRPFFAALSPTASPAPSRASANISNGWRYSAVSTPSLQTQFESRKLRTRRFSAGSCLSNRAWARSATHRCLQHLDAVANRRDAFSVVPAAAWLQPRSISAHAR